MTRNSTESAAQQDFKAAFRRSLLLKSSLGLFVVSILLVLACLLPLAGKLKNEQEKSLFFAVRSRSATVEIFLEKAIETTRQVTSRTQIRKMLEKYNRGEISHTEFVSFTRPKLEDALSLSENGIAVSRFDAGNKLIVSAGQPIPAKYWIFPNTDEEVAIKGPELIDGQPCLIVSAPILTRTNERAGTDIALFTTEKIQEIIQDTSGLGNTGEMILGRLGESGAMSFFPLRTSHHSQEEDELFHRKELTQAFALVAQGAENELPLLIREGHTLKVGDRVKNTNWIILCRIDKEELYSPINTLIFALVIIVTVLLILGLIGMNRLLNPLADKAIVHSEKLQQELAAKQEALRQREESDRALSEEKEQLAVTLRSIADCVITTDPEENIELFNCAAEQLLGCPLNEAHGKSLQEILPIFSSAGNTPIPSPYKEVLNEFQPDGAGSSVLLRTKSGREKKVTIAHSPMRNARKDTLGTVWVIRDVTEREKFESHLRQTQKMEAIGTLAAGIAHDFNNILTAILGFSQLVRASLNKKDKEYQWQEEVILATHRAQGLVKQILTFCRQTEHEKNALELSHVVKEAVKLIRATIPATIEIKQNIRSGCGLVLADPTQIHQIVMNLCTNAFHAMSNTCGTLTISLQTTRLESGLQGLGGELGAGDYVLLEVEDTGPGIDPSIMDKIFEPYFTTKGKGQGTGLGLAVVQGIVKSCDGAITVHSGNGAGTTFRIYFPTVAERTPEQALLHATAEAPPPQGNEHILVVDDERSIAELIREILEDCGYRVTAHTDPHLALEAFTREPQGFDLLITDISMPKLTGYELAKKCKAVSEDLPILLCTGNHELVTERQVLDFNFNAYISKPLVTEKFALTVRRLLDAPCSNTILPPEGD
ncbi:hybrid sensor histidine kinase/response regulator [Thiovibrio sp. JS02]